LYNNLDSCGDVHCTLGQLKKEEIEGVLLTCGFYKCKTMDDNQNKFIPQLAIDTEFSHSAFVNPCML